MILKFWPINIALISLHLAGPKLTQGSNCLPTYATELQHPATAA